MAVPSFLGVLGGSPETYHPVLVAALVGSLDPELFGPGTEQPFGLVVPASSHSTCTASEPMGSTSSVPISPPVPHRRIAHGSNNYRVPVRVSPIPPAVCRSFADRYRTWQLQVMQRLWGFVEVLPPEPGPAQTVD